MLKLAWGLIKLGLLSVFLALIFHNFTARFFLIWAMRAELGTAVEVERAKVDLLNTRVSFEDVKIKNPEGFPREPLALIPRLDLDFEVSSWKALKFHVDELKIECDEIRLVENPNGQINFLAMKIFDPSERGQEEGKHMVLHRVDFSLGRLAYSKPGVPGLDLNLGIRHMIYEEPGSLQLLLRRIYQDLAKNLRPESWNQVPARKFWPWGRQENAALNQNPPSVASQL